MTTLLRAIFCSDTRALCGFLRNYLHRLGLFSLGDLLSSGGIPLLAGKLLLAADRKDGSLASHVWDRLGSTTRRLVRRLAPAGRQGDSLDRALLRVLLLRDLNAIVWREDLGMVPAFRALLPNDPMADSSSEADSGADGRARRNRVLIQKAFPGEVRPLRQGEEDRGWPVWPLLLGGILIVIALVTATLSAGGWIVDREHAEAGLGPSVLFTVGDLTEGFSLGASLRDPRDPVSSYLRGRLSTNTVAELGQWQPPAQPNGLLRDWLIQDLNAVVLGPRLWDQARFESVQLRDETRKWLDSGSSGAGLPGLNRLLLEDAYPRDLRRSPLTATAGSSPSRRASIAEAVAKVGDASAILGGLADWLMVLGLVVTLILVPREIRARDEAVFQGAFVPAVGLFNQCIDGLTLGIHQGRDCFQLWMNTGETAFSKLRSGGATSEKAMVKECYEAVRADYEVEIEAYLRHFDNLCRLLQTPHLTQQIREKYSEMLIAQLSKEEKLFLGARLIADQVDAKLVGDHPVWRLLREAFPKRAPGSEPVRLRDGEEPFRGAVRGSLAG